MLMYDQTLRKGFDDATCGTLVRATLAAYLPADEKLGSRTFDQLERSFSKIFFLLSFLLPIFVDNDLFGGFTHDIALSDYTVYYMEEDFLRDVKGN